MASKKKVLARKKTRPEVVQPAVIETTFNVPATRFTRLQISNLVLAAVYTLQGIAVVVFTHAASLPVTLGYLVRDPLQSAAQGNTILTPATHEWFTLSLSWLVAVTLWVLALSHLLAASRLRRHVEADMDQRTNRVRWLTYMVSSSLVLVTAGLLSGVQNVAVLTALVGSMVILYADGLLTERPDAPKWPLRKLQLVAGLVALVLPLAIITQYLLAAVVYGTAPASHVWAEYGVTLVLFISYAVNFLLQRRGTGKWADYLFGEQLYLVISLLGLSAFAWLAVASF